MQSLLRKLNKNSNIIALQDASISLVPILITITIMMMLNEVAALFTNHPLLDTVRNVHGYFYAFFPLIFTVSLSVAFAKSKNLDVTCMVILNVSLIIIAIADGINTFEALKSAVFFKILPIPLCLFSSIMVAKLALMDQLRLFHSNDVSIHLKRSFNFILPSFLTFILFFVLLLFF